VSPPSLVVVGGGIAGIACALGCADAGMSVTVLEARNELGGLVTSFEDAGLVFDNGQHIFLRCCTAYQDFLRRIGSWGWMHIQERLDVPVVRAAQPAQVSVARIFRTGLPVPLHLSVSLLRYGHLSLMDRVGLLRSLVPLVRLDADDPSLDDACFGEWLTRHGQRTGQVEALWDLIVKPALNVASEEASLALAVKVLRTGLLERADGADMGWSKVPLRESHGRCAMRALTSRGVEVMTSTKVVDLRSRGEGWKVTAEATAGKDRPGRSVLEADAVVIATDHRAAARLAPPGSIQTDVKALGFSPIVNAHMVLDRKVLDEPVVTGISPHDVWVFDRSESSGLCEAPSPALRRGQCLSVSLSDARGIVARRSREVVAEVRQHLEAILPRMRSARLVHARVTREASATFRASPGSRRLRPTAATRAPGLFLAGAYCQTGWPATMESAVRSAVGACDSIAGYFGSPVRQRLRSECGQSAATLEGAVAAS
jgi:squalene-associated FAD-dependent desaturase